VRLTTMDWLAQFRDAALKTALAKPELSAELTNLWNSQETEEGQWRSTAHLWRPLVQVPGTGKTACDETDSFEGMSPDDWLRARIELALWVCSAGDRSPVIPAPGDRPSVVSDWELPWSVEQETARAARASACTAQRLRALRDWESGPVAGCATFECLWDLWLREAGKWPLEAQEKALRLLTVRWDGRLAEGFAKRFAAVAPEQALSLLEWFEPLLPHGVRVQIRDQLRTENCLQDAACLPVLLQAVAFANRREVRSAGISGQ